MGQLACGAGRWQEFVGDSEGERSQLAENSFPFLGDSSSELPAAVKGALVLRGEAYPCSVNRPIATSPLSLEKTGRLAG